MRRSWNFGWQGAPCLVGTVSLMPADNVRGMRADTLALLKQLDAPMYRWPGGNFVSGYDWRDGIGDRDRRPPRVNPAWTGVEHNDFGIDEFIDFCREVNAEPMIAANTGFGDAYSAAQEVEYCNGAADTVGGSWRVKNGHPRSVRRQVLVRGQRDVRALAAGLHAVEALHDQTQSRRHRHVERGSDDRTGRRRRHQVNATRSTIPMRNAAGPRECSKQCADKMDYLSEHFYVGSKKDDIADHVAQLADKIREHCRRASEAAGVAAESRRPNRPHRHGRMELLVPALRVRRTGLRLRTARRAGRRRRPARVLPQQRHHPDGPLRPDGQRDRLHQDDEDRRVSFDDGPAADALSQAVRHDPRGGLGQLLARRLDVAAAWTEDRKALTIGDRQSPRREKVVASTCPA